MHFRQLPPWRPALAVVLALALAALWIAYTTISGLLAPDPKPVITFTSPETVDSPQRWVQFDRRRRGPFDEDLELLDAHDTDGDGRLNAEERQAARETLAQTPRGRRGWRGQTGRVGGLPGPDLSPEDVEWHPDAPLYDLATLRTLFVEFESDDWERELEDFYHTDVEVPATLIVDGREYPEVGVNFRGNTSYTFSGTGWKRPLKISLDYVDDRQRLGGYRTLNLLNSMSDPTFLRIVLYMQIARDYMPAPKANFVRLVINGESWGVYVNVQQFNSDFLREWFPNSDGARWKTPGSPRGGGGLAYWGDNPDSYRRAYEIKTKDEPESWQALIHLCEVLSTTSPERLEQELAPLLDIDGVLRFLAIDKALINNDGYWTRASDYSLYMDSGGQFHVFPYDTNESFRPPEFGWGSVELDPFAGAEDPNKPLLSRLLAVPSLRDRYLAYLSDVAERWLDWDKIGPLAEQYQALIANDMASDTHSPYSFEEFQSGVEGSGDGFSNFRGGYSSPSPISLKEFVEQRRAYLLSHPDLR